MTTFTGKQAGKLIELLADTSSDQVQAIYGSGLLTDLRDADISKIDREEFRRMLGLKPLNPPLLEVVGTITVPATIEKFVASEKFTDKQNGGDFYLGDNFKKWFLGKTEEPQEETVLRVSRLTRRSLDAPIRKELGQFEKIGLSHFFAALADKQSRGDYTWTVAYIDDVNGDIRAVVASWRGVGWGVFARSVEDPDVWVGVDHVLSRLPAQSNPAKKEESRNLPRRGEIRTFLP